MYCFQMNAKKLDGEPWCKWWQEDRFKSPSPVLDCSSAAESVLVTCGIPHLARFPLEIFIALSQVLLLWEQAWPVKNSSRNSRISPLPSQYSSWSSAPFSVRKGDLALALRGCCILCTLGMVLTVGSAKLLRDAAHQPFWYWLPCILPAAYPRYAYYNSFCGPMSHTCVP